VEHGGEGLETVGRMLPRRKEKRAKGLFGRGIFLDGKKGHLHTFKKGSSKACSREPGGNSGGSCIRIKNATEKKEKKSKNSFERGNYPKLLKGGESNPKLTGEGDRKKVERDAYFGGKGRKRKVQGGELAF